MKKTIALFIALVMVAAVFAGCQGGNAKPGGCSFCGVYDPANVK